MIDLHLHTTASDGLLPPAALVARVASAGLTVISITDHDTVAGISEASRAAGRHGLRLITGIEVTSVENGKDVHILGYFIDPANTALAGFLLEQRTDRSRRVREMGARLQALGCGIDVEALLAGAEEAGRSIGRPVLADALVAGGRATDRNDAFARLLGRGRPAFVARRGVSGAEVIGVLHAAGGIASLAHPGVLDDDAFIPRLVDAGLDALEAWHSDHSPAQERHYVELARRLGLARTAGSDYHGDGFERACRLGAIALPASDLEALESLAGVLTAGSTAAGLPPENRRPGPAAGDPETGT